MFRLTVFLLGSPAAATLLPRMRRKCRSRPRSRARCWPARRRTCSPSLFPDLEPPPEKAPELLVPEGTKNLALKKKITSSESEPILGKLEFVTDGNKEGSEESFVELSPGLQWIQIDLEKPAQIYAIYVWHFFREARSYHDVIVQVADDETVHQERADRLQQRHRCLQPNWGSARTARTSRRTMGS